MRGMRSLVVFVLSKAEPSREAVMRGLGWWYGRVAILVVVMIVLMVALLEVTPAGATTVGVDVHHGQTLVERGRAPSGYAYAYRRLPGPGTGGAT